MSFDLIPKNPFPDVPLLPGVPLLARAALTAIIDVEAAILIATQFATQTPVIVLQQAARAKPVWGVFDSNGNKVISPDNVMAFDYRAEWSVSNFPVQNGQFASYNKVLHPFDTSVVLTKGGTENDRTAFILACESVAASLNLFTIMTPEKQYLNCNVTRMEMSRKESKGAFFVSVELFFTQIVQVDAQYSSDGTQGTSTANASVPNAVPSVNQGTIQALPPSPQTAAVVNSKLTTGQ
jgi:hypothetical protein